MRVEPRADVTIVARHESQPVNPPADLDDLSTQLVFGFCHRSNNTLRRAGVFYRGTSPPLRPLMYLTTKAMNEFRRSSVAFCASAKELRRSPRALRRCSVTSASCSILAARPSTLRVSPSTLSANLSTTPISSTWALATRPTRSVRLEILASCLAATGGKAQLDS